VFKLEFVSEFDILAFVFTVVRFVFPVGAPQAAIKAAVLNKNAVNLKSCRRGLRIVIPPDSE
jgi:hypothetical protein